MIIKKRYDVKLIKTQLYSLRGSLFGSKNTIFKIFKNGLAERLIVKWPKPKGSSNDKLCGA